MESKAEMPGLDSDSSESIETQEERDLESALTKTVLKLEEIDINLFRYYFLPYILMESAPRYTWAIIENY